MKIMNIDNMIKKISDELTAQVMHVRKWSAFFTSKVMKSGQLFLFLFFFFILEKALYIGHVNTYGDKKS